MMILLFLSVLRETKSMQNPNQDNTWSSFALGYYYGTKKPLILYINISTLIMKYSGTECSLLWENFPNGVIKVRWQTLLSCIMGNLGSSVVGFWPLGNYKLKV